MLRACAKRPVSYETLERAVSSIEQALFSSYDREIPSVRIGELTMEELKKIDEVAYIRFASVYRQFADVESFLDELKKPCGRPQGKSVNYHEKRTLHETLCSVLFCSSYTSRRASHSSRSTSTCARRNSPSASSVACCSRYPSAARSAASSSV